MSKKCKSAFLILIYSSQHCYKIVIYLCVLEKRSSWDGFAMLRKNWIFRALLQIKKSFTSINFDLAKYLLVFSVNHLWIFFFLFFSNLKIKMSLLKSKNSSNTLIKKRIQTEEEKNCWESGNNTVDTTDIQLGFLYPRISANQAYALNRFLETTILLHTTTSAAKGLIFVYEI